MTSLLLATAVLVNGIIGDELKIKSVDELIQFKSNVEKGTSYEGTTVLLESDLDFTEIAFEPIGNYSKYFNGTFEGQGHVISNLKMNSTLQYVGLFGYSEGLTIRNVILDSSCSIVSSIDTKSYIYSAYEGGIIGYCYVRKGQCIIENNVNMASVTFSGTLINADLCIGGIAGSLESASFSKYEPTMKNCANYGSVTHSGKTKNSYIGGVVGNSNGYSTYRVRIYNSLNHGTITHSGTTQNKFYFGGILGYTDYTIMENCVNGGEFSLATVAPSENYIGGITGYIESDTSISYCYFTSGTGISNKYGCETPLIESNIFKYDSASFNLDGTASIGSYTGTSLIDALNAYADYYTLRDYPNWLLNKDKKAVSFTINGKSSFTLGSQLILLPSLANRWNKCFDGWYTDNTFATPFTSHDITENKNLYGKFEGDTNEYTIIFETRKEGVSVPPKTTSYNVHFTLPNTLTIGDCSIGFWETSYGDKVDFNFIMLPHNFTLYAVWKCTQIETLEDFIDFSKVVNSGTSYSRTTVLLDSDIDLTEKAFDPILTSSFTRGVFDGQGHVISNLKITSSSEHVGLFGGASGFTIKNVILDSSCSIESSFKGSSKVYVGGILGDCIAYDGACNIENSVNMASVTFSGTINNYLYLGGIAGNLESTYSHEIAVKNCANYGDINHFGENRYSYIGGIAGYSYSYSPSFRVYIYNSLNHGTITHSGITNTLYFGGIAGYTKYTTMDNSVSSGKFSFTTVPSSTYYIGSAVGFIESDTFVNYCYFTSELDGFGVYGYGYGSPISGSSIFTYDITSFKLTGTEIQLVNYLNKHADSYTLRDYSNWLLNKNKKTVSFTINGKSSFTFDSQLILLPSLASEGTKSFDGWYTDSGLTTPFTSSDTTENKNLYGKFEVNTNNYTITFDTRGGSSVAPKTAPFNSVVSLPNNLKRGDCSIGLWETSDGDKVDFRFTIPPHNITLYAVWKCTHIKTTEDFIDFSKVVNSGTSFSKTTVFLESDIDLTDKTFEPIGYYTPDTPSNFFSGIFNGQGHTISNFIIKSPSEYVGLFGYSEGLSIRNVILDSSCSIRGSYNGSSEVYVGGIIGYCYAKKGQCNIENNVNMGSLTFTGSYLLNLGGIAGCLYSYSYDSTLKNCANYGEITYSGRCTNTQIGGVIGYYRGSSTARGANITNCINYGTITDTGISTTLYIGGIVGRSYFPSIENCVSEGKISTPIRISYIGIIAGYAWFNPSIHYCYYTSELSVYNKYGGGIPSSESNIFSYDNTNFAMNGTASIGSYAGTSLVGALNAYADSKARGYSGWLLNKNKKAVSFTINGRTNPIRMSYQIILMPNLASEGNMNFDGWYEDSGLTTTLKSSEVTGDKNLYGRYCGSNFTVTLDVNGGNELAEKEMSVGCDRVYGKLPVPTRIEATFLGWFTEKASGEKVETGGRVAIFNKHTLYAHWNINKYTITFEVNGGSECKAITQDYNTGVVLPEPTKIGYTFDCWCSDSGLATQYTETTMPAKDVTLYAKWKINQYTITFVFNNSVDNEVRTLDYNEEIVYPENVVKTGYTFNGWDNKPDKMPAENITVAAQWTANKYTVTFDVNGGNALSGPESKKQVTYDSTYGDLPEATKTGYYFIGWYTGATEGEEVTSESIVKITEDKTLYAHWALNNKYTITFVFNNGNKDEVKTLEYKEAVKYPENPTREGYTFAGWDKEITTMPAENVIITAQWTINQYVLTFVFGNGDDNEVRTLDFNAQVDYPDDPVREGYSFAGWDKEITAMPANNLTITALWTLSTYVVTFNPSGGSISQSTTKTVTYGSAYGELPTPTRTGFAFLGWFTEKNESITKESIVKTPADHTLYAHWLEISRYVEITFGTKDITRKEIEEIIKKYTDASFKIVETEKSTDETRVIAEFVDEKTAKEFVDTVKGSSEAKTTIKKLDFVQKGTGSFSLAYYPMLLLYLF